MSASATHRSICVPGVPLPCHLPRLVRVQASLWDLSCGQEAPFRAPPQWCGAPSFLGELLASLDGKLCIVSLFFSSLFCLSFGFKACIKKYRISRGCLLTLRVETEVLTLAPGPCDLCPPSHSQQPHPILQPPSTPTPHLPLWVLLPGPLFLPPTATHTLPHSCSVLMQTSRGFWQSISLEKEKPTLVCSAAHLCGTDTASGIVFKLPGNFPTHGVGKGCPELALSTIPCGLIPVYHSRALSIHSFFTFFTLFDFSSAHHHLVYYIDWFCLSHLRMGALPVCSLMDPWCLEWCLTIAGIPLEAFKEW